MSYMASLPDKAFTVVIADPPYGINFGNFNRTNKDSAGNRYKADKYKNGDWDSGIPDEAYFNEIKRVSENQIIWGGNYYFDILGNCKGLICWYKHQPVDNFSDCEFAWTSFNKPAKVFDFKYFGNIEGKTSASDKVHPTQKPIDLYRWLNINYVRCKTCEGKGEIFIEMGKKGVCPTCSGKRPSILDTHLGSGSSAIAAFNMGIDFVGTEIDKDYYDAAMKRFKNETAQGSFNF